MAEKRKKPPFVRAETLKLPENHNWKATPDHKICVIGRGDLRFEYPQDWVNSFGSNSIKLHDRPYPRDDMVLEVSVLRTPTVDWNRMPDLSDLLLSNLKQQGHLFTPEQVNRVEAPGLELTWAEYDKIEEDALTKQPRPATWRQAHCHPGRFFNGKYLPVGILTFGFWSEHRERADTVWQHVLATIVMGEQIADPRIGPRYN